MQYGGLVEGAIEFTGDSAPTPPPPPLCFSPLPSIHYTIKPVILNPVVEVVDSGGRVIRKGGRRILMQEFWVRECQGGFQRRK